MKAKPSPVSSCLLHTLVCGSILLAGTSHAVETVLVNIDGSEKRLIGRVIAEDSLGTMLLETDDGAMLRLDASHIRNRTSDSQELEPLEHEELGQRLLEEMGPGFQVHESKHFVVVHNTTRVYARWCSSLLERLQRGFVAYWRKKGAEVEEPEAPLAVLVFGDERSYKQYSKDELGASIGSAIGYYSIKSNRIVMYDLTGMQALRRLNSRRGTIHDINAMLSEPEAEPLVATIVHEATHQISFNCGLQKRLADNPIWLGEGLAMFCETPDLSSRGSWSGFGRVNYARWDLYRKNANAGKVGTLKSLIVDDERFRNPRTAVDAYAEAWAWNYFLITWHTDAYVDYLKTLAEKPVLATDDEATRVADFTKHFGSDFQKLEEDFYRRMSRVD